MLNGTSSLLMQYSSAGTLWFLNWPDNQLCYDDENNVFRKAKNGYWKCVDACKIQTGTSILGVKLCLEFHEGQTPCGTRSGLMMYEYLIEQNDELNLPQVGNTYFPSNTTRFCA